MNKVFKDINRNVLINILNEKISDKRFIDLISSMHKVNLLCLDGFLIQKINGIIKGVYYLLYYVIFISIN